MGSVQRYYPTPDEYKQLPIYPLAKPPKNKFIAVWKKIEQFMINVTVIGPYIQFFIFERNNGKEISKARATLKGTSVEITKKRWPAMEERIQKIAEKARIKNPKRFELLISPPFTGCVLSRSLKHIQVSYDKLLKKEDLPSELAIEKIDGVSMTEDQWCEKFIDWFYGNFYGCKVPHLNSQSQVDRSKAWAMVKLDGFRNPDQEEKMLDARLGREIGACVRNEQWHLLFMQQEFRMGTLPTFGLTMLFEDRINQWWSRIVAEQTDLFCAKKMKGAEGFIDSLLNQVAKVNKILHGYETSPGVKKYPQYNAEGECLVAKNTPLIAKRVEYLKKATAAA